MIFFSYRKVKGLDFDLMYFYIYIFFDDVFSVRFDCVGLLLEKRLVCFVGFVFFILIGFVIWWGNDDIIRDERIFRVSVCEN